MSGTTKHEPKIKPIDPPDMPDEIVEETSKPEPEPVRVAIRAVHNYSNGTIPVSINWKAGEVRMVTMGELIQLRNDDRSNFEPA